MAIFEISNPSDPYTLKTDRWDLACLAALCLGSGRYGLDEHSGERKMPIFLLGGSEEWVKQEFGVSMDDFFAERVGHDLADVLDSVMIGSPQDRESTEDAVSRMSPEDAAEWLKTRHDRKRSSMNDIGGYAAHLAKSVRKKVGSRVQ